jgi:type II secretory pathway pseudopilin PulG
MPIFDARFSATLSPAICPRRHFPRANGFTYLSLMIIIAIIGIATVASVQMGVILQRRSAEQELLEIGGEFQAALISYANATPAGQKRAPAAMDDLLKDPRYPNARRHLRKRYADPLTGKDDWGTIMTPDGSGIAGFFSLADGKPIKIGNFVAPFQDFEGKTSYRDWKFIVPQ